MQKWTDCQKRLVTVGKHGLFRRVREFDFNSLNAEQASQAHNLIGSCLREEVAFVSTGAEVFYCWVSKKKLFGSPPPGCECLPLEDNRGNILVEILFVSTV